MKRERVIQAINHIATDIIPYNIELTKNENEKVCRYVGIPLKDFPEWADNHIEKFSCEKPDIEVKPGYYADEFGVIWNRTIDKDIGVIDKVILENADMAGYTFPQIDKQDLEAKLEAFTHNGRDTFKFAKINFALFERAWSLRGFENMLMDFILNPDFAHELLDRITERNIKVIETVLKYDIDGIYLGDDYGQQTGMLMSPQIWREFIKPNLKKMCERVKSAGKYTCLHSCGNILPVMGDLIDIGLDIYQTVQPEIYDLSQLKKEYGNNLTFYGAISTQRDLPSQSPEKIKEIIQETMSIMGKSGGYIAAPTHKVPDDVPVENITAMLAAFKEQKK